MLLPEVVAKNFLLLLVPKSENSNSAMPFMLHFFSIAKDFSSNNKDSCINWTSFPSSNLIRGLFVVLDLVNWTPFTGFLSMRHTWAVFQFQPCGKYMRYIYKTSSKYLITINSNTHTTNSYRYVMVFAVCESTVLELRHFTLKKSQEEMLKLPKTVEGRRKVVAVDFWFVCSGFAVSVAVCSLVHGTLNNSGYANCKPCNQGIYCNIGKYKYSHIPAHHQWAAWVISMYVLPPLYRSQCHHPKNDFDQHAWEFAWKQWFEGIKNKSSWFSIK